LTDSRGRTLYCCSATYVFLFTILPSARTPATLVATSLAFAIAIAFILRVDDTRARHAAFWAIVVAGIIAWSFDGQLAHRFDAFTGLLGMLGWGACALLAASPEVFVETAWAKARRWRGVAFGAAGVLALLVHVGAWFADGTQEARLLAHALSTVAALFLAAALAAPTRTRRVAAAAGLFLAVAALLVSI
jgi:hypothetical protein